MIAFLLACHSPEPTPVSEQPGLHLGPEQVCALPAQDAERLQLQDVGLDQPRQLDEEFGACNVPEGATVARDLDLDGDPEVLVLDRDGLHALWDNRDGRLHELPLELSSGRELYSIGAGDLDGDGLPELVATGWGVVLVAQNLGELRFGPWQAALEEESWPVGCYASMSFADVDLDGDLDLSVAGLDLSLDEGHLPGSDLETGEDLVAASDLLLLNEGGQLVPYLELEAELPRMSMLHVWTDRDLDGDLDFLGGTDRFVSGMVGMGTSWRNDGTSAEGPLLFEDGHEIGFCNSWAAMGMASWDANGDGLLDHCVADYGGLRCLLGDGLGGYFEADLGLETQVAQLEDLPPSWTEAPHHARTWVPWGLRVTDLDADGHEDLLAVAGPVPEYGSTADSPVSEFQPDWLWMGGEQGFESQLDSSWMQDEGHFGLVEVDLDGDGYRELIKGGHEGQPQVFDNPCGQGSWLEVEVLEPQGHVAFGAQVQVLAGERSWLREIESVRAFGQSEPAAHFGLGQVDAVDLLVRYPDGEVLEFAAVPVNRQVTVSR